MRPREVLVRFSPLGDCWDVGVEIDGAEVGGGTASSPEGVFDVAADILFGGDNDFLNGDSGALGRMLEDSPPLHEGKT